MTQLDSVSAELFLHKSRIQALQSGPFFWLCELEDGIFVLRSLKRALSMKFEKFLKQGTLEQKSNFSEKSYFCHVYMQGSLKTRISFTLEHFSAVARIIQRIVPKHDFMLFNPRFSETQCPSEEISFVSVPFLHFSALCDCMDIYSRSNRLHMF